MVYSMYVKPKPTSICGWLLDSDLWKCYRVHEVTSIAEPCLGLMEYSLRARRPQASKLDISALSHVESYPDSQIQIC